MKLFLMVVFGVAVLSATITLAERKGIQSDFSKLNVTLVSVCQGRPGFITEVRPELIGSFEKLPRIVLVANEAEYYVESKSSDNLLKIHSYQSFLNTSSKENSKIVCGNSSNFENTRFSLFGPTLVDTTNTQKVGQSLWQFQMLTDKEGFSVWNKRSLAFVDGEDLEKALMKFGGSYRIYKLSADKYELVVSKDTQGIAQYLSIKYDAVKSL